MNLEAGPLFLERHLSSRLWGGSQLQDFLGLEPPGEGDPWGESWQVWGQNLILNGPLAGRTLQQVAIQFGPTLLGTVPFARYGAKVPLLAKFIDAAQDLSLQVHPDDAYARQHHAETGDLGKAEAWLVLAAEPGSSVYWGFREQVSRELVEQAVADGTLAGLLNQVPVKPGDVVYNPAGTVHAIGSGILLFEIQQSSDLTYRLYDYGRRDSQGRLRELHLEHALAVADLDGGQRALVAREPLAHGEVQLVACEHFVMTALIPGRVRVLRTGPATMEILTAVDGPASLGLPGQEWQLPAGTSVVLPAVDAEYSLAGNGRLIRCFVPG